MPKKENLVEGEMLEILSEIGLMMQPLGYNPYYYKKLRTGKKRDGYMYYLGLIRAGAARMTIYYHEGTLGVMFPGKHSYELFNIDSKDETFISIFPQVVKEDVFKLIKESLPHY